MQGQLKKKEEEKLLLEAKKKQVPSVHAILTTEGPMKLKDESRKVEDAGRTSFEHSVKVELDAIKKRLLGRKKKKGEKKPSYGWKLSGGSEPPEDDEDEGNDEEDDEGEDDSEDEGEGKKQG